MRTGLKILSLLLTSWLAGTAGAQTVPDTLAEARALAASAVEADSERRLDDIVRQLSTRRGDTRVRELLEELALRAPQVYVRHEEGHAMIPLVDVGAAARAALRNWDRLAAFDRAMHAARTVQPDFVARYFAAGADARQGTVDAVAQMKPVSLLPYRADIAGALGQSGGDALAAAAALALGDAGLAADVIRRGSDNVVQRLIPRLPAAFGETAALQLLESALGNEFVASLALFQIDRLQTKQADQTVWASLSDPELGGTAAAIIARRTDRDTTRRLIALMKTARAPLTRQRARLALTLSDDPLARAEARAAP